MSEYKALRVGQLLEVLDESITLELWTCGRQIGTALVSSYRKGIAGSIVDYRVISIDKLINNNKIRVWYVQGDDL